MGILCNKDETLVDVFFDDLKVEHVKSPAIQTDDYYPFGLTFSSYQRESTTPNQYLYNGKELQDELDLTWLDYGARMYDNQLGRWYVVDSYSEVYYGLTPYNYGGNNPVNTIDIDGNLFIFANGFMLDHWKGGTNKTMEYRYRADPGVTYTVPNPNYYDPDRGYYSDGPRNNGETFDYWEGVDAAYMNAYEDENALYTNGSFTPRATAGARFNEGQKAGADLIAKLESGEITLQDRETIKIVGHSQGAAYAAGIASALAKHSKYGSLIEFVDYLSPHQPGDITHPEKIYGRQFSTKSDKVSSRGWISRLFGHSEYEKIQGTEWGKERESSEDGRGGHSVGTWLNELIDYWKSIGVSVTVHE